MKKKAYLYLGLLGVGLMLGGLSALISKNVSETLAYELDCYDSTSTYGCPSGSTEIGKYCTTDVIDAYSSSACKGKGGTWIDDKWCYKTVDKVVRGYSCPNGGELSSDELQCCTEVLQCAYYNRYSCENAYSNSTQSCTCIEDSDGCWKKDSCTSIVPTSCNDYTSSTMRNNCSNCQKSGGSWNFNNDSCSCPSGYVLSGNSCIKDPNYCSSDSECGQFEECNNNRCVVNSIYADCFDTSVSYKSECKACIDAGNYWGEDNVCKDSGGHEVDKYSKCDDYSSAGQSATKKRCNSCTSDVGTWSFTNHTCTCKDGYTMTDGICVKNSSTGPSKSGYYFINSSGQCSEYPDLPGYCIQPGTLYYSNAEYYACDWSLSCEQAAAAYYGNSGGAAFYTAQGSLNGRTYYTDSNCTNALATTGGGVTSEASRWCNTKPSFDGNVIALKVGESVTLTDVNGVLGEYSVSSSSGALSVSVNGNTLSITANKETSGTDIILSKGSRTPYQAYCSSTSQAYAIASALPYVTAGLSVYTTNETVEDTYGGFKIIKKSDDGTVLEGVKFKIGTNISGEEGSGWRYYSTDSNGEIEVSNIKTGTKYYYQEVETLDGYILDNQVHNLTIKANTVLEVEVINYSDIKAVFKLIKTNEGGIPLPGVKFKIGTDLNGTEGSDWSYMVTNESGYITVGNIDVNTKYYYQEVETLEGYIIDNEIREIIIDGTNGIYVATVINYGSTSATIIKKDAKTGTLLRNVEFEIYSSDNTLLYTKKTDKDGKIVIQGIKNGKYYAKEKEAPDGYLLNKDKHYFEISDSNKNVVITIKNVPDNPDTGSIFIYTTMIVGAICLGVSIYQYRKLKNVEFM